MTPTITKSKSLFVLMGLGLVVLLLLACSREPVPRLPGGNGNGQAAGDALGTRSELLGASGIQRSQPSVGGGNTGIWVNGTGEASSTPDLAILNMGVEALADTVAKARGQAASAMAATIDALEAEGVDRSDIQTRTFSVFPRYTRREVTRCNGGKLDSSKTTQRTIPLEAVREGAPVPESFPVEPLALTQEECFTQSEQVLLGFQVTNQLTVKVRDLDTVGDVIDRVTGASGDLTRFQGVKFTIEDAKDLQEQARAAAVDDLMAKAEQVAALAGVELGRLTFITETGGPAPVSFNTEKAVMAFAESAPTPILTGEMTMSVNIQGSFEIAQSTR
ncbi:MAG: hypothetical protein BZY88_11705 [SAR202 cluster bacterium Io17-Chloro-G9]|nr:MAG: hypothetical protein BZY88_11705 [SAR202 cluster bacterium Io17-Chloro-G9]